MFCFCAFTCCYLCMNLVAYLNVFLSFSLIWGVWSSRLVRRNDILKVITCMATCVWCDTDDKPLSDMTSQPLQCWSNCRYCFEVTKLMTNEQLFVLDPWAFLRINYVCRNFQSFQLVIIMKQNKTTIQSDCQIKKEEAKGTSNQIYFWCSDKNKIWERKQISAL